MGVKKLRDKIYKWTSKYKINELESLMEWFGIFVLGLIAWIIIAVKKGLVIASATIAILLLFCATMFIVLGITYALLFRDLSFINRWWFIALVFSVIFSGSMFLAGIVLPVVLALGTGATAGVIVPAYAKLKEIIEGR